MKIKFPVIIILCLVIFSKAGTGQNAYRISFITEAAVKTGGNIVKTAPHYYRQIITDTSIFIFPSDKKSKAGQLVYGDKIIHHSSYFFSVSNQYYYGNNFTGKAHVVNYKPKVDSAVWRVDSTTTFIYRGFRCAKAYCIKRPGDTTKVLYTADIKYPPDFNGYRGLPGVVLESYNTYYNTHSRAIAIDKGPFEVILPPAGKIRYKP